MNGISAYHEQVVLLVSKWTSRYHISEKQIVGGPKGKLRQGFCA